MSFPRSWLWWGGAAVAFALVALLYSAAPDAFLLGVRVAPGLPFRIAEVGRSTTPTLTSGTMNHVEWDTRPDNITQYPGENIALCPPDQPARLSKSCIILSYYAPNSGEATVYVPPFVQPGAWNLVLTAWNQTGDRIIPAASSAIPVQVTAANPTPTNAIFAPTPTIAAASPSPVQCAPGQTQLCPQCTPGTPAELCQCTCTQPLASIVPVFSPSPNPSPTPIPAPSPTPTTTTLPAPSCAPGQAVLCPQCAPGTPASQCQCQCASVPSPSPSSTALPLIVASPTPTSLATINAQLEVGAGGSNDLVNFNIVNWPEAVDITCLTITVNGAAVPFQASLPACPV